VPGRPDIKSLASHVEQPRLGLLNLNCDAMPADDVTMIVTEVGSVLHWGCTGTHTNNQRTSTVADLEHLYFLYYQ